MPGLFPGAKGDRCLSLTILQPLCAVVMKFGNLKFLESSGQTKASDGILYLCKIQQSVGNSDCREYGKFLTICSPLFHHGHRPDHRGKYETISDTGGVGKAVRASQCLTDQQ